jgi:glutathione S-transferase
MPPTLKLVYIEGLAARAFPTRFALRCAGLSFVDQRISREELQALRSGDNGEAAVPLGQLPVLYINGAPLTQSMAQSRWAASRSAALSPAGDGDGLLALAVDETMQVVDELWSKLPHLRHFADRAPADAAAACAAGRAAWLAGVAPRYLRLLAKRVSARGGPFVLGEQVSIADAWVFAFADQVGRGFYDGVPTTLLAAYPALSANVAAFRAHALFATHGEPM